MKKRLWAFLLSCLLVLCLLSCAASDGKALPGRWRLSSDGSSGSYEGLVLRFDEDGKIHVEEQVGDKFPYSYFFGTYVVDGGELYIYCEGELTVCTFSVKGEELTLTPEGENSTVLTRVAE